jgi:hypothetical protein
LDSCFQYPRKNLLCHAPNPKYTKPQKATSDRKDAKWIANIHVRYDQADFFIHLLNPQPSRLGALPIKQTTSDREKNRPRLPAVSFEACDVFSDVFGKSARAITSYIWDHPGESFDVAPFVDSAAKHPLMKSKPL